MPHLPRLALTAIAASLALAPLPVMALEATQTRVLKALGVPIVLPAVTPPGARLARIIAQAPTDRGPGAGPSYAAVYEGEGGLGFAIESTSEGIGDFPGQPKHWFSAKALKAQKVPLYFEPVGDGQSKSWISAWVEHGHHFYRFVGAHYARQHLSEETFTDREVDASWAQRIAASLRPVKL